MPNRHGTNGAHDLPATAAAHRAAGARLLWTCGRTGGGVLLALPGRCGGLSLFTAAAGASHAGRRLVGGNPVGHRICRSQALAPAARTRSLPAIAARLPSHATRSS